MAGWIILAIVLALVVAAVLLPFPKLARRDD